MRNAVVFVANSVILDCKRIIMGTMQINKPLVWIHNGLIHCEAS